MKKLNWWPKPKAESTLDVAAVYRQFGRLLWANLHRLGVAQSDLPDVMQEVLVVIHRRLPSFDSSSRIEAWLFGICVRVAANDRRRAHRRHERALLDVEPLDHRDPEVLASLQDDRTELNSVLDRIEPPKRAVFLMFEVEGLSCQQIADELGIPVGTVHSRLHGARRDFDAAIARMRQLGNVSLAAQARRCAT